METLKSCTFGGCKNPPHRRGYCTGHGWQQDKGRPLTPLRYSRTTQEALMRTDDGRKLCIKCEDWKPESEFDADSKNVDGLRQTCKACRRLRTIMRKFNITPTRYRQMLVAQEDRCAICRTDWPGERGWHIDHDHACCPKRGRSCGKCVRGLLCGKCNVGLAMFNDSVDALRGAIAYLNPLTP